MLVNNTSMASVGANLDVSLYPLEGFCEVLFYFGDVATVYDKPPSERYKWQLSVLGRDLSDRGLCNGANCPMGDGRKITQQHDLWYEVRHCIYFTYAAVNIVDVNTQLDLFV